MKKQVKKINTFNASVEEYLKILFMKMRNKKSGIGWIIIVLIIGIVIGIWIARKYFCGF